MKYFIFILVPLLGCSHQPIVKNYRCTLYNREGSFVRMDIGATSLTEAIAISDTAEARLEAKKVIPSCASECYLKDIQ